MLALARYFALRNETGYVTSLVRSRAELPSNPRDAGRGYIHSLET